MQRIAVFILALSLVLSMLPTHPAGAVQLRDIVRVKGSERNTLVGVGLVVGLNGTGDGEFGPAARSLAQLMGRYLDPNTVAAETAEAANVAVVSVVCDLPRSGAREGDEFDVRVSAFNASSLEGGELWIVPLVPGGLGDAPAFAFAAGQITIEDEDLPTAGVIAGGARMLRDVRTQQLDEFGRMTLVVNQTHASYTTARNIALLINGVFAPEGPEIARAVDESNVEITLPVWERENPVNFIAPILETQIAPEQIGGRAIIIIDERSETIAITGNVEVSPVAFSHNGVTLTVLDPEPEPDPFAPVLREQSVIGIDPAGRGGTELRALVEAFNRMGLDTRDQIEIIRAMKDAGVIHAEVITR